MLIAGNWKMNGLAEDASAFLTTLLAKVETQAKPRCDLLICPPTTLLSAMRHGLEEAGCALGAQDCHFESDGAHTGDVAAPMLADAGCTHVIVGHSERRADHGEDDATVKAKAEAALAAGLAPIVCVGETEAERDAGEAVAVVENQLRQSLPAKGTQVIVAYEPVWAIGTGRTPTTDDVAEMHGAMRALVSEVYDAAVAERIPLLYGGSVKPGNAAELLAVDNVDGALVGGASLKAEDFWAIAQSCP